MSLSGTSQKIDQIIQASCSVYVYTELCNSIVVVLKEIREKVSKLPSTKQNACMSAIFDQLNSLYDFISGFSFHSWFEKCCTMEITAPVTILNKIMNSIIETLKENGISLQNKYLCTNESIFNDIVRLHGILTNPKIISRPKVKVMIDKIEKYFNTAKPPSIASTQKNTKVQEAPKDNDENDDDADEFLDYGNVQKYKIKETDYIISKKPIYKNDLYTIYNGQMSDEKVTVLTFNEAENNEKLFKRLVNVLTAIQHPNLETFIGAVNNPPLYAVVTKRVGKKLYDILSSKKVTDKKQRKLEKGFRTIIAFNIASAMAYLHSNNIIHRDLCSSNITVDKSFNPKIINFTNSRFLPDDLTFTLKLNSVAYFKAPELIKGVIYDKSVDVFAFGGILYELMMGSFANSNIQKMIIENKRPKFPNDISDDLKKLIEACWSQNPKDRPSFAQIINDMISKKITFPTDKDSENVSIFYTLKTIRNNDTIDCLKLIQLIKDDINKCYVYKNEAIRIRSILHNYQYHLQTSSFASQEQITDSNIETQLFNLSGSLEDLHETILRASKERWIEFALLDSATDISANMLSNMEEIYVAMKELSFPVTIYEYDNIDLYNDYNEIYKIFQHNSSIPEAKIRMEQIENFLQERSINLEVELIEFNGPIDELFHQYNEYELKRDDFDELYVIGSGATSIVLKAKQLSTEKYVAIKQIEDIELADLSKLKRELFLLIKLQHEYLVPFVGFNYDLSQDIPLWIVSEFIDGGDLYTAIAKKRLTPFQKTKIAFEIAEGMEYIHSKCVIHRDLKTLNIVLNGDTPLITDFGLSRSFSLAMSIKVGTKCYMAPEVLKGTYYDYKADVFSYASMLWEMYSGQVPFFGYNAKKLEDAILFGEELKFEKLIHPNLEKLIKDGRDMDPTKRPSFTEILKRMLRDKIAFYKADEAKVNEFYRMKAEKRPDLLEDKDE